MEKTFLIDLFDSQYRWDAIDKLFTFDHPEHYDAVNQIYEQCLSDTDFYILGPVSGPVGILSIIYLIRCLLCKYDVTVIMEQPINVNIALPYVKALQDTGDLEGALVIMDLIDKQLYLNSIPEVGSISLQAVLTFFFTKSPEFHTLFNVRMANYVLEQYALGTIPPEFVEFCSQFL